MSKSTLEQANLAREQMKNEFESATESSRAALSAISGRLVLKTKKETEKIRRDEELAAQKRAAGIAFAQAGQEISMEQSRLDFDRAERNREEQERRSLRNIEAQEQADRRKEAMEMLSVGLYDPSFSVDLGFSDSVVKEFAEKKNVEFKQKQAKKRAVAKAKADYEASIEAINKKKEAAANRPWYHEAIEKKLKEYDSADENNIGTVGVKMALKVVGADGTKKGIVDDIVESKKELYETGEYEWVYNDPKTQGMFTGTLAEYKPVVDAKAKEKLYSEISAYYDKMLSEKILKKEKSGESYSAVESAYKEQYGNTAAFAIATAQYELGLAAEKGDVNTYNKALNDYSETLKASVASVDGAALSAITKMDAKRTAMEQFSEEERAEIKAQIVSVQAMIDVLARELAIGDFSVDQQDVLAGIKEHFEGILSTLQLEEDYAVEYEKNPESYKKAKETMEMDRLYGSVSMDGLEAELRRIREAILAGEDPELGLGAAFKNVGNLKEQGKGGLFTKPQIIDPKKETKTPANHIAGETLASKIARETEPIEDNEKLSMLRRYVETRKQREEDAKIIEAAQKYAGETLAEKMEAMYADVHEKRKQVELFNHNAGLHIASEWLESGDYSVETDPLFSADWFDVDRAGDIYKELLSQEQKITNYYHQNIVSLAEEWISDEDAKKWAENNRVSDILASIDEEYEHGGEFFDGDYSEFDENIRAFERGEYGSFDENKANRVIALLAQGKYDFAFSYYANVREEALLKVVEDLPEWQATFLGISSGLDRFFRQGGYMLENAITKSYERMAGTVGTASHQVTVERLDQMGFGGKVLETFYMAGYTIMDMLPAVALGFIPGVGPAASSGYIFAKSMATTYTDDIAAGKRADEALTHSVLDATSEVVMERLLGSIPGVTSQNGVFAKLKTAIEKSGATKGAKTAIRIASSMGSEGFEEFLQEVLSPFLEKMAADLNGIDGAQLGEIDWEEAWNSFLLGAITGGAFSVAYTPAENRAMEIEAARSLSVGEVDGIIGIGAQLENKTALRIKEAVQNQQPRYEGQEGIGAYASAKDVANIQKSIRKRRVKGAAKTLSAMIEANMEGADPAEIKRAKGIFRKVLTAQTLTLEEASTIAKDERLLSILEGMMGEELLGKDIAPRQIALLARLASFTDENGKVSKARLALFKDAFGEFDTKAIEQILRYDSMAGILEDGVIYENKNALDETQQEAAETLNVLSEMSGIHFLVTDQHQTGDYLASGLMAVNLTDLDQGIFYAIGHQAYQMIMQLEPEKGLRLQETILQAAKNTLGEEGVAEEINTILQQKAVSGLDYSRSMAEDEFCARYYSVMLTQDAYTVDRTELAAVRKRIEAFCNENRITEQERKIARGMILEDKVEAPEAEAGTGSVRFEKGAEATTESQKQAVKLAKVVANAIGIDIVFYDSTIEGTYGADSNGFFNEADSSIHLDLQKNFDDRKTIAFTMSHELTHFIKKWSSEKFDTFAKFLEEQYGEHGISMDELVKAKQEALGIEDPALAYEEVVCDACERMLLDSKAVEKLAALKQKDQGLFRRFINHIRSLLKRIRAEYSKNNYAPQSAEAQALQQMEGVLDKFYELFEDAALDAAANYQSAEGAVDLEGKIKEQAKKLQLKDPKTITEENIIELLGYTYDKVLSDDTFIPVRINTPQILIAFAKELGYTLDDYPLAMRVYKARQAVSNEENWDGDPKDRPHDLSFEEVIEIIRAMDNPSYLVFQTENDRFSEIVKFERYEGKEKAYAIIDFSDEGKNPDIMNGYKGGKYNILVTIYPSDNDAKLKAYLNDKDHIVMPGEKMKKKGELQGSYGGNTPSLLNNSPFFENSISQDSENSQEENLDTFRKQRKSSHNLAPGRNDVVAELAELYRQEGILQEARGLGGVDADAFLENAYAGVDRLADTDIESAEMLRKVLGSIEQHFGESKVSGDIISQLENRIKDHRWDQYGWGARNDAAHPGTEFDPENDAIDSLFTSEEVAAQNDGADFTKDFADMDPFEQAQFAADRQAEIDALFEMESGEAKRASQNASSYMALLSRTASNFAEENASPEAKVTTRVQEDRETLGEKIGSTWNFIQRKLVDSGDAVYDIGRRVGDKSLYHFFNSARSSYNAAISMIRNVQTNVKGEEIGKGLSDIFKPIMQKGAAYYEQFQNYLYHLHNIDRMSRESVQAVEEARAQFDLIVECYPELSRYSEGDIRKMAYSWGEELQPAALEYIKALEYKEHMENIRNLPVFGPEVSAEVSMAKSENLLREHPEFKELSTEVYRYLDNLIQYRVDSGLISKEFADQLKTIYPHYVPARRVQAQETVEGRKGKRAAIGKTVGRAEGGSANLVPLHKQIADQTISVVREGSKNRFGMRLLEIAQNNGLKEVLQIERASERMLGLSDFEGAIDKADPFHQEEWENLFMVYKDGVQYVLTVRPELLEAVKALSQDQETYVWGEKTMHRTVDLYKKLITSYNPTFAVRNFVRDIQDALLYSKDLKRFIVNYPLAWKEICRNGKYWQQYQALGGTYTSIYDHNRGIIKDGGTWMKRNISNRIEWLNMAIEQTTRLAEFMATVKKGDGSVESLMEGMYNAADITVNFGRSGTLGRRLNRNWVPFFNPSIQGWSKACRMLTETKGFRQWAVLISRAALLGAPAALINGILAGDDDEYDKIRQRDKDVNFLIKVGDHFWLKIPKGRVLSVLGMSADRVLQLIDGDEIGWGEFISTASDQISPMNPLTDNVFASALTAIAFNKNWYGGDIVPQSMQDDPVEEQYDATTDAISIAIGKFLGVSPKKINYLLDSYTGVLGDIILPALSVASEQNFLTKAFVIDTDYSNRLQGDFYDTLDELTVNKNSSKATVADEVTYRWWNKKASDLSEINKKIKSVQADENLSKAEKDEGLKVLYAARNAAILQAEDEYERYTALADEMMNKKPGAYTDEIYREVNRKIYGAEEALKIYNESTYERAKREQKENGVDFETFYEIYFDDTVDTDQAIKMIGEGFEKDSAITLAREFETLEPEAGAESVSYMQKYKAIAGADVTDEEKLFAMSIYASDSDRRRVAIGTEHDISLEQFVAIKENIEIANEAAGKNSASNGRIQAAIASTDGLTRRQQAILWQLFTGSKSAKNNPFSVSAGWEAVAEIDAYKKAHEED